MNPAVFMRICADLILKLSLHSGRNTAFPVALDNVFFHPVRRLPVQKNHRSSGVFPFSVILGIYMTAEKIYRGFIFRRLLLFPGLFLICIFFHILIGRLYFPVQSLKVLRQSFFIGFPIHLFQAAADLLYRICVFYRADPVQNPGCSSLKVFAPEGLFQIAHFQISPICMGEAKAVSFQRVCQCLPSQIFHSGSLFYRLFPHSAVNTEISQGLQHRRNHPLVYLLGKKVLIPVCIKIFTENPLAHCLIKGYIRGFLPGLQICRNIQLIISAYRPEQIFHTALDIKNIFFSGFSFIHQIHRPCPRSRVFWS